jgi:hypothetical protein
VDEDTLPSPVTSWLSVQVSDVGKTHRTPSVKTTRYSRNSFHIWPAGSRT